MYGDTPCVQLSAENELIWRKGRGPTIYMTNFAMHLSILIFLIQLYVTVGLRLKLPNSDIYTRNILC